MTLDNTSATSSNTKETAGKSGVPASKKTPARKRKRTIEESDEESDMELDDFGDDDDDDDDDNDDHAGCLPSTWSRWTREP